MTSDDRIIELLAEMVRNQDITNQELVSMGKRLGKLEEQQAKTNLAIGELRLSVMKLAEGQDKLVLGQQQLTEEVKRIGMRLNEHARELERVHEHERRIGDLERAVFKS